MTADTVFAGDSTPVEVVYSIVNGPSPSNFDNHPGRFSFSLTGPDGGPAESLGGAGPALGGTGEFLVLLPGKAALLQRQDLRCVSDGAYESVPLSAEDCLARYALARPGRYRLIVSYDGPDTWLDIDTARAAAARGEHKTGMYRPIAQGLRLADTVGFTVRLP